MGSRVKVKIRDYQRSRVYRLDDAVKALYDSTPISLEECRALVKQAFHGRKGCPVVTDGRGRCRPCGSILRIRLPRASRLPHMVLHECAHGMATDRHGPQFVARYMELLVRHLGLEFGGLVKLADEIGVDVQQ